MTKPDSAAIRQAWDVLKAAASDPEWAWALHCNLAMPIADAAKIPHADANTAAAHLMQHLFDCDITTHPFYGGEKSGAQQYAEIRIAAEREEDEAFRVGEARLVSAE